MNDPATANSISNWSNRLQNLQRKGKVLDEQLRDWLQNFVEYEELVSTGTTRETMTTIYTQFPLASTLQSAHRSSPVLHRSIAVNAGSNEQTNYHQTEDLNSHLKFFLSQVQAAAPISTQEPTESEISLKNKETKSEDVTTKEDSSDSLEFLQKDNDAVERVDETVELKEKAQQPKEEVNREVMSTQCKPESPRLSSNEETLLLAAVLTPVKQEGLQKQSDDTQPPLSMQVPTAPISLVGNSSKANQVKCSKCGKTFSSESILQLHECASEANPAKVPLEVGERNWELEAELAVAKGVWKVAKDVKKRQYYYNPTTKKTVWNLAKELKRQQDVSQ